MQAFFALRARKFLWGKRWAASRNSCSRLMRRSVAAIFPTILLAPFTPLPTRTKSPPTFQNGTVDGGNTRCVAVLCAQCIGAGASYRCLLALLHPDPWQDGRRREHTSHNGSVLPAHRVAAAAFPRSCLLHSPRFPRLNKSPPTLRDGTVGGENMFHTTGLTARASGRCRSASPGLPSGNSRRRRCWCGDRRRHRGSWRCSGSARRRCGR